MAGHPLQGLGGVNEFFDLFVPVVHILQGLAEPQGVVQGNVQRPRPAGHLLGHQVHLGVGHVQHPPHVPDGGPGGHGPEGDDLGHPVVSILPADVIHHLVPAGISEIHVDIRHTDPLRVQKPLKVQPVLHGLYVGDVQAVGHHAPRGGAAPRSHGDARAAGEAHEVRHDEEIVCKSHFLDHVQLVVQLPVVLRMLPPVFLRKALLAQLPDAALGGLPFRHPKFRQMVLPKGKLKVAQLRDPPGVLNGPGVLAEQFLHFLRGAHVEVPGLVPHPLLVLHQLPGLDAQQHVVGLRVLGGQVVAVVGTHQRDAGLLMDAQQSLVDHGLVPDAVVLELQIEPVLPEELPHLQGVGLGILVLSVHQPFGDLPRQTGGQGDKPPAVLPQQLHIDTGLDVEPLHEAHADHVAEVPVPLLVPAQQDQVAALGVQLVDPVGAFSILWSHVDLAADDGLDPLGLTGPVEVDGSVHNAVVRDRHGGLAQGLDPFCQTVDLAESVQEAVLRMDVEVDKRHGASFSDRPERAVMVIVFYRLSAMLPFGVYSGIRIESPCWRLLLNSCIRQISL